MKSGWQSTEFWLTLLTSAQVLVESLKGTLDPKTAAIILAVLAGAYNVLRVFLKTTVVNQAGAATPPASDGPKP